MKIGYFIPGWPPGSVPNGIVSTLGRLGVQLRELGHEVYYVTPFSKLSDQDQSVTVLEFFKKRSVVERLRARFDFESAFFREVSNRIADAVQKLIEDKGIEIFQMEETHGWARTVLQRVSIPVVVRLHGPWFMNGPLLPPTELAKPENKHRLAREGDAIHLAAGVAAPANDVLVRAEKYYGRLSCPTQVIPNPIIVLPEAERWKLNTCDCNLILFIGRFDRIKGADVLLTAFAKLARDRPLLRLIFVGPDFGLEFKDGRHIHFAEFLNQEIPSALYDRIDYRGPLSHGEIQKLRVQAYLTVVCSRYENFANTVMESMAAGCPTVATNTGGIPEMLKDNRNGLLAPPGNIDGLADAIAKILDDSGLALRLGQQAAQDCLDWFEPQTIAQRTVDFYTKVIAQHHRNLIR